MSKPTEVPVCVIVVPPTIAALISELTERMAKTMGETIDATRRGVELSVLSRGAQAVQGEISIFEEQARKMGWPST